MDETVQESPETNASPAKTNESSESETTPTIEKSETDSTTDQQEEIAEDQQSGSECSDGSRTPSDDASVVLEREEGDGQESAPNRKVDDDEDKRNPQYIPKRGTFYEHDDRTAVEEGAEEEEPAEAERTDKDAAAKKKVWSEKEASKWNHDRFNDTEQAPKSRQELISIYGYDIRNEEGPPRARRRRRYGRGPNKYTRNWEDEDAYSKPTNVSVKPPARKPRTRSDQEEFPPLGPHVRSSSKSSDRDCDSTGGGDAPEPQTPPPPTATTPLPEKNLVIDGRGDAPPLPPRRETQPQSTGRDSSTGNRRNGSENGERQFQQSPRRERGSGRMPRGRNDEPVRASVAHTVRGVTKTRGFFKSGGRAVDTTRSRNQKNQKQDDEYSDYIMSQNFTNKSITPQQHAVQKLEKDMANMTMQQHDGPTFTSNGANTTRGGGKFGGGPNSGGARQTSVPPRLQGEQRGSKRYSSLRQRSLPETAATPAFGQHPTYYQAEYAQQASTQPQTQQGLLPHPPAPLHSSQVPPTTSQQILTGNPPLATNGAPPLMQAPPPQFAPQPYPQGPAAFLPAGVAPPPFIAQQAPPQIINYAQPQFSQQFPNFQHQQFTPVNQPPPAELYQPQGGITYYSPQNQQIVPRVPQKRVKAAIPIVPPPEHKEPRGRGRLHQGDESPGGSAPDTPADIYTEQQPVEGVQAPVAVQQ